MIDPRTTQLAPHIIDQPAGPDRLRLVWAALTANPHRSIRAIAAALHISPRTASAAIQQLAHAGYVEIDAGIAGGRRVVVPFVVSGPLRPLPYPASTHRPRQCRTASAKTNS